MKTFIVPTDFSETSKNAAMYAALLAADITCSEIILYYEFDNFVAGSDSSPLSDEPAARKKIAEIALQNVKAEMQALATTNISYVAAEESSFIKSLAQLISERRADIAIMGITITSSIEQTLVGSSTLNLVDKNICPVLIVPPEARYKGIKNVLFATDYKELENTSSLRNIKAILGLFEPVVHIVNVNKEDVQSTTTFGKEKEMLDDFFKVYNTTYHFLRDSNFTDALSRFVKDKSIDLIVTIPRKHAFYDHFFTASHTHKLVYNIGVPVLAIHE